MIKIKKYKNRKLYDTETGTYVNFADLNELIQNDVEFVVIDSTTKNDITPSVLTEMFCHNLKTSKHMPTAAALRAVIKNPSLIDNNGQLTFNFT